MGRSITVAALCAATLGVGTAPALAASDAPVRGVCGTGTDAQELVTHSVKGAPCADGLTLIRGWRNADNPRRYRGFTCGDVPKVEIGFTRGERWFASWQCRRAGVTYRLWTAY